jgi:hypothetical protein
VFVVCFIAGHRFVAMLVFSLRGLLVGAWLGTRTSRAFLGPAHARAGARGVLQREGCWARFGFS